MSLRALAAPWVDERICVGSIATPGFLHAGSQAPRMDVVRATDWKTAGAGARAGSSVQLRLLPRERGERIRHGARVYFAKACKESSYHGTEYASVPLLGRTISMTVDLSKR